MKRSYTQQFFKIDGWSRKEFRKLTPQKFAQLCHCSYLRHVMENIILILVFTTGMTWAETAKDTVIKDGVTEAAEWFVERHKALSPGNYDEAIKWK